MASTKASTMLTTEQGGASSVQLVFKRSVQYLLLLLLTTFAALLEAQTVTIKLVDGRSGRPMAQSHVNVWVGNERKMAMAVLTDEHGIARLRLTANAREVDIPSSRSSDVEPVVIDPVLKDDDFIRINVGYVLCEAGGSNYSWLAIKQVSTKQLINEGIAMPNTCGKTIASSNPGELIIFVRPLTFWEKLKE
jgi:hypothetical protein